MKKQQDSISFEIEIRNRIQEEVDNSKPKLSFSKIVNALVEEAFKERDRRKGWKKNKNATQDA